MFTSECVTSVYSIMSLEIAAQTESLVAGFTCEPHGELQNKKAHRITSHSVCVHNTTFMYILQHHNSTMLRCALFIFRISVDFLAKQSRREY